MNTIVRVVAVLSVVPLVASARDYEPIVSRKGVLPDHIANSEGLIHGAEFQDLILPLPAEGMTSDTWGAENSKPRSLKFGIEDPNWSYWGGNILRAEDGTYHMFVCRWPEDHPKGIIRPNLHRDGQKNKSGGDEAIRHGSPRDRRERKIHRTCPGHSPPRTNAPEGV